MKVFLVVFSIAVGVLIGGLSPSYAQALSGDLSLARQAVAAAKKDRFDEALRTARQSRVKVAPLLVTWMAYVSGRSEADFAKLTAFIDSNPDWPLMTQLVKRAEESITAATPNAEVLAWFDHHPPTTADGGGAYARSLFALGRNEQAIKVVRETWTNLSFGALQERQYLSLFSDHLRYEDHWGRLDRLLWDRQETSVQRMILKVDAGHRSLAQARLALQNGKANPEPLINAVPVGLRDDPGLIYERVRWRRQNDLDDEAIELLRHPSRNKIRADLWWQERAILARRALQKGHVSRAYQTAADHGLEGGTQYVDAEFLAGWIALRFLDDRDTATLHFSRLYEWASHPISRGRAAYWAGRASEAGNESKARDWFTRAARYSTTYYGQLGASKLGEHHWPLPDDPRPAPEDISRFETRDVVAAAKLLMELGDSEQLRAFFIRLNDIVHTPGERALVAQLASRSGRNDLALTVARRSDREGVTLVEAGWPVPSLNAQDGQPEMALILALIRQESGFMADVESPAGARGLMQLLPSTASRIAKAIKLQFHPDKLDNPDFNVRVGSAYLGSLLSDFQGSYILALASYNAGPGRARRWIKENGDPRQPNVDVVDWIEMIPFGETRNYVQRVMESVAVYRQRLGKPAGPNLETDLKRWARKTAEAEQ